ncbi:hypothetical protein BLA24_18445 [Streptomyces cinnamoneus]|uniref:Uncharacterized protein n=1 Tax=Streptomyces cinnamoneus TaxID=53446 RepID=A0A2G1XI06_STRCJ|nr:DUF1203 domain-containing protein [Streptomyces cinnamoneus]PHQ50759.1 hypothetical protein BLA24_18445 [Streptomyces cinnamoneus]PPT13983.1 DUF1203 domain-containing protein [Streptomyces cinnamoneus]
MTTTTPAYEARAIDPAVLRRLREQDDAGFTREPFTDTEGGAPLRCCLRHSAAGEHIALVSYAPLRRWAAETGAAPGAYDECGPVFVHADACGGQTSGPGYPAAMHGARRMLRAYDARGHILGGTLVEIPVERVAEVDDALRGVFADPEVALVHVRAVEFGCFLMEVRRAADLNLT